MNEIFYLYLLYHSRPILQALFPRSAPFVQRPPHGIVVRVKAVFGDSAVLFGLVIVIAFLGFQLFAALHLRLLFLRDGLQNQPKERHSLDAIMPARKKTSYSGKGYGVFFEMFLKKTGQMSKTVRSIC